MGDTRPGTFSALWVEGALGPDEQPALRSFVVAGCPVELDTSDEHRRPFPVGVTRSSKLIRFELLRARDTTWIDAAMVPLDVTVLPDRSQRDTKRDRTLRRLMRLLGTVR